MMASSQMLRTEKVVTAAGGRSAYRAEGTIPYRGSGKSRYRGTGKGPYHAACRRPYRPHSAGPPRSARAPRASVHMRPSALKGMGSARHHPHSGQRILCRSMHSLDRVPPMGMCRSMHGAVPFLRSAPPHSGQHGVSGAIVPLNARMSTSRYLGSAFVPMFLRSFDRTGAPRWTKPSSPLPNQRAPPLAGQGLASCCGSIHRKGLSAIVALCRSNR